MCMLYVYRYLERPEECIGSSFTGVTGTCEMSYIGTRTPVLCKSSKFS